MTNSEEVAARLDKRCDAKHKQDHKHIPIWETRAREAQRYPKALCQAVAAGIKAQKEIDESKMFGMNMEDIGAGDSSWHGEDKFHEDPTGDTTWAAWDDMTGKELDPRRCSARERPRWNTWTRWTYMML